MHPLLMDPSIGFVSQHIEELEQEASRWRLARIARKHSKSDRPRAPGMRPQRSPVH
jgi:hypothetical protein